MRLFLTPSIFISILPKENNTYSCQVMELIFGVGCYPATFNDNPNEVVSSIVASKFKRELVTLNSFQEVLDFHLELLKQLPVK